MTAYDVYRARLVRAQSDSEKWRLTVRHFAQGRSVSVDEVGNDIRRHLVACGYSFSELWLDEYPDIIRELHMVPDDLRALGERLDAPGRVVEEIAGEDETGAVERAYYLTERSTSAIARAWLLRMTGREFAERSALQVWLRENKGRLVWDRALGQFGVSTGACGER